MALQGQRVLLGVTGGIAAYKSPELVRRLIDQGAEVRVVMTQGAQAFVTPLTFQAVSGFPVGTEMLDETAEAGMGHIELARWADAVVIAPATADFIARLAHGFADDLLATICLATDAAIAVAPAMNRVMWTNAATQDNLRRLNSRAIEVFGPGLGAQACGETGAGRMLEPTELVELISGQARHSTVLTDRQIMVTAGPTYEDLDPVRYLGNRSSGKMGFAIADAAARAGAQVNLIAGPVELDTPRGVSRVDVRSAREMREAIMTRIESVDIYISAAAVADFRPLERAGEKIKKSDRQQLTVQLTKNPDILAEVAALSKRPFTVGFAAETEAIEANAREKLQRKGLDVICANDVGSAESGFEVDKNALRVIWPSGTIDLGPANKREIATQLIGTLSELFQQNERAKWNERSA